MYACFGRPSIASEKLLRSLLLQILYSIRSDRMLMEQLEYNLLFRWFVGLNVDDPVWVAPVYSKNRDRLLYGRMQSSLSHGRPPSVSELCQNHTPLKSRGMYC
jgi:transposase